MRTTTKGRTTLWKKEDNIRLWEKGKVVSRRAQEVGYNIDLERGMIRSPSRKRLETTEDWVSTTPSSSKKRKTTRRKYPLLEEDWGEEVETTSSGEGGSTGTTPTPPPSLTTPSVTPPPPPPPSPGIPVMKEDDSLVIEEDDLEKVKEDNPIMKTTNEYVELDDG